MEPYRWPGKCMGGTQLHHAVRTGDLDEVQRLLTLPGVAGVNGDVNGKNDVGCTALFYSRRADVAFALVNAKAILMAVNESQGTPLHWAALNNSKEVCEILLAEKVVDSKSKKIIDYINVQDKIGFTAMHIAATYGYIDVVESLISHKADVRSTAGDGRTPLHVAALGNHAKTAKMLIDNKADVGQPTKSGDTALRLVSGGVATLSGIKKRDKPEIVSVLEEAQAHSLLPTSPSSVVEIPSGM